MTTPIQSSKGIPPCEYSHYLDATIARIENAQRHQYRRRMLLRALIACIISSSLVLTAWIHTNL